MPNAIFVNNKTFFFTEASRPSSGKARKYPATPLSLRDDLFKIPRQAFALKKNRCGTSPVSKASDNKHTAAALGHSEILSVKHSVGEPIPAFDHAPENGTKVPSAV